MIQSNSNQLDLDATLKLHTYNFEQYNSVAKPLETRFFKNYFLLMEAFPHFKKRNVLDVCEVYNLFSDNKKIIYEQYDCVDIDTIKINSNKIFLHLVITPTLPLGFIDDIIKNIQKNAFPNSEIFVKTTVSDSVDYMKLEVMYTVGENIKVFDEAELVDIYHSLTVLNINPELQEKVKEMLIKAF